MYWALYDQQGSTFTIQVTITMGLVINTPIPVNFFNRP